LPGRRCGVTRRTSSNLVGRVPWCNLRLEQVDNHTLTVEIDAMTTREQYVVDEAGRPTAVLVPLDEWERIQQELEELGDIRAYDEAKRQPSDPVPFEQAMAEINGDAGI